MKDFWYRKNVKRICIVLQAVLAGILVFCLLRISRYRSEDMSLRDMGRSFENTGVFYQTVQEIVGEKVRSEQDRELFETDGGYDENKLVDIRQYVAGTMQPGREDPDTSYKIGDLLRFAQEDAGKLLQKIDSLSEESYDEVEAGNSLLLLSSELETILPVSGTALADSARLSSGSAAAVVEYERNLCDAAADIARRYRRYQKALDKGVNLLAPSNVHFYIENTSDRKFYSNFGATSLLGAEELIYEAEEMTFLFEGERRSNIMVSKPERVLNNRASDWFNRNSFLGSGEKILIAVDQSYPVDDQLQKAWKEYQKRFPYMVSLIVGSALSFLLLLVFLFISAAAAGRSRRSDAVQLHAFDYVPAEIAAGLCLIAAMSWWMLSLRYVHAHPDRQFLQLLGRPVVAGVTYLILLISLLSLLRRIRSDTIWKNSVLYYVVLGTRQVYSARKSSQRLLILYIGFVVLNMFFLLIGGLPGAVMALILNFAALLYLMRDVVGNQNVREGLHQISEGKLDYRINTDALTGESREMGEAVNEMGDGLEKAVESMIRGERLKAELITNVSHDLKTPLTSIINYVDLLKRRNLQDEKAQEYLQILDQKTQRLKTLTEDLIEASKISSGNVELHPQKLQLQQFIFQAVGEFEDRLQESGITISMQLEKESIFVYVDGARLWRVFENLLGNIAKYGKKDTQALLCLTKDEDNAFLSFKNESASEINVSEEQLLERFGRGDESRRTEGFGLGLSIADSLVQLMGGTFGIKAEKTEFEAHLSFPLAKDLSL